jgi:Arylsulfotransferase (ASST)
MRPFLWCCLLACSVAPFALTPPVVLRATTVVDAGPLVRTLHVQLARAATIDVDVWTDDARPLRVSSAVARLDHAIPLVRLRAGRTYHYQVVGTRQEGSFRTDALPADLAKIRFSVTGQSSTPLALVHLFAEDGFKGYVIVDRAGDVVWFWRTNDFPFGMSRRHNGNFVFMDKRRGLVEVTPTGQAVHELAQEPPERELHHDAIVTPDDTVLYLAFDTETVGKARVKGESIWEWWPDRGTAIKRWRSWDHLSVIDDRGPRFAGEWMHANSLAIGPRGNILVSAHYFNQILSISSDWRRFEWRLGGVRATIPLDPAAQFSGQHTPREIAPGRLLLFDNGRDRGGFSRAVEYAIADGTASVAWEWRATPANYSSAVGSARRLPNGNTLVAFGMSAGSSDSTGPTEAFEVTPEGAVRWRLLVSGTTTMYRVEPISSIAGEVESAR